jgi:sugar phosphate isomerase/epimerase
LEVGIFARTFDRGNIADSLDAGLARGFRLIHFNFSVTGGPSLPTDLDDALCSEVRREFELRRMRMLGVSGTYNLIHRDVCFRAEQTRRARELIKACPALGTNLVTLCSGTRDRNDMWRGHPDNDRKDSWADMRVTLGELLSEAESSGVRLGVEPEPGNVVSSAKRAHRLLKEMKSPQLAIVLDPVNLASGEARHGDRVMDEALELLASRVAMVHAKGIGSAQARDRLVDWDRTLILIKKHGVSAPIVIHDTPEGEAVRARALLEECLSRLEPRTDGRQ